MARTNASHLPAAKVTRVTLGPFAGPFGTAAVGWAGTSGAPGAGVAEFFADRLAKDIAAGQDLMACTTLADVQGVQMRYLADMATDYLVTWPGVLLGQAVAAVPARPAKGLAGEHADDHMGV